MAVAEGVLQASDHRSEEYALLWTRLTVRRSQLARLYTHQAIVMNADLPLPKGDHRSYALENEVAILKVHEYIDCGNLTAALQILPLLHAGNLSELEKTVNDRVGLVRGYVYRFAGHFLESYTVLNQLPPSSRVVSHLSAVICELGDSERAIGRLKGQLQLSARAGARNRLRLALADAYLCKCMQAAGLGQRDDSSSTSARKIYEELRANSRLTTRVDWLRSLSIQAGLAILAHLEGHAGAKGAWEEVLSISRACGLKEGYTDAIVYYSMSVLAGERGEMEECTFFAKKADALFRNTGRQHYFTALGSLWPEILRKATDANGLPPVTFV
ncbi:hypothetical protein DL769_003546 [Monosporascus sp. CRB-8-3]|nr:hypothetical protein DL769_003546 [Monosporascus sp. CRB-8-3]